MRLVHGLVEDVGNIPKVALVRPGKPIDYILMQLGMVALRAKT